MEERKPPPRVFRFPNPRVNEGQASDGYTVLVIQTTSKWGPSGACVLLSQCFTGAINTA